MSAQSFWSQSVPKALPPNLIMMMTSDWQIGDRIQNRWEVHKIMRGGMGVVYVVYDHEWHRPQALKTFQDEIFARDPTIAERFTQEALTWINLGLHQNVVQTEVVQAIDGKPYLFLEYVSGGDLNDWIGTPRLMEDLPQVLRFAIQFCDGMSHALSKGIKAHRDVKPQNCLITHDLTLKVTDFGLAKVFDSMQARLSSITSASSVRSSRTSKLFISTRSLMKNMRPSLTSLSIVPRTITQRAGRTTSTLIPMLSGS